MNHTTKTHSNHCFIRLAAASILVVVFTSMLTLATNCLAQNQSSNSVSHVYDDFSEKWIDPARWLTGSPGCWGLSLECVRQIRDGQLNLAARNIGSNAANSDTQWSQSDLFFVNPNNITSITADVTVRSALGTNCLSIHRSLEPKFASEERSSTAAAGIKPTTYGRS